MEKIVYDVDAEIVSPACRTEESSLFLREEKETSTSKDLKKTKKKTIPVFFASDDNYLPFLTVALSSMKRNASKRYDYRVYVLQSGLNGKDAELLMSLSSDTFKVSFVDVSEQLKTIEKHLHLRDYYTSAIYYRLFIVGMFPQYDKAVYLDSDTVVLGDIAELYNTPLGEDYIAAAVDQVVASDPVFGAYTKDALGIEGKAYFNSGVIVMHLKKFRSDNFYDRFYKVLSSYDFIVAPDQDCLNLLCKGKVKYLAPEWNAMPVGGKLRVRPKLVHYNLALKPWHYDGVTYGEYFWEYAENSFFFDRILRAKKAFTPEMAKRDEEGGKKLLALADSEAKNERNYIRTYGENHA